jgi:hypothetical protein
VTWHDDDLANCDHTLLVTLPLETAINFTLALPSEFVTFDLLKMTFRVHPTFISLTFLVFNQLKPFPPFKSI